jgi:hypothetical protein
MPACVRLRGWSIARIVSPHFTSRRRERYRGGSFGGSTPFIRLQYGPGCQTSAHVGEGLMRYRLSFSLSVLAALVLAGCGTMNWSNTVHYVAGRAAGGPNCIRGAMPGDTKIQVYCPTYLSDATLARRAPPPAEGDVTCRNLSESTNAKTEKICRDAAQWEAYDIAAVKDRVSCRWSAHSRKAQAQETCLAAAQWRALTAARRGPSSTQSNWPGHSQPSSVQGPSSSYGYFPAGTAIGAR